MLRKTLVALLCVAPAFAQSPPRLLADLDPRPVASTPASSLPASFARLGAWTFFAADDGVHGRELFRTNGTAVGTALFADLLPGLAGSSPQKLIAIGTRLFFLADDGIDGVQPWVSDGTVAGTRRIAVVLPGARVGEYTSSTAFGSSWLFYVARMGARGLWITDGTAEGTARLVGEERLEEAEGLSLWMTALLPRGGVPPLLMFRGGVHLTDYLWRTDGTAVGTQRVVALSTHPLFARVAMTVNGRVVIHASESLGQNGWRSTLWSWDGFAAPAVLTSHPDYAPMRGAELFDGRVWFIGGAPPSAFQLVTDGTAAGTRWIPSTRYGRGVTVTASLGVIAGSLWLTSGDQLFRVDPGMQEPVLVGPLPVQVSAGFLGPILGARRLLVTSDRALRIVDPLARTALELGPNFGTTSMVEFGEGLGRAYFAYSDPNVGTELWMTDGTPQGTRLVADLRQQGVPQTMDSLPQRVTAFGSSAMMATADRSTWHMALWRTEGTAATTTQLTAGLLNVLDATRVDDRFFVRAQDAALGSILVVTDGTVAGTRRVPVTPLRNPGRVTNTLVAYGSEVIYLGSTSDGPALFACDGTTTRFVKALPVFTLRGPILRFGERIAFVTQSVPGQSQFDLWVSDGTSAGTNPVASFDGIHDLVRWRGRLWFVATDQDSSHALWSTDGTPSGTARVAGLPATNGGRLLRAAPDRLFVCGGYVLEVFDALSGSITTIPVPLGPEDLDRARIVGSRLVFASVDPILDQAELWSSDGSMTGTGAISARFRPAVDRRVPLTRIGDRHALFALRDSASQNVTWITDGTSAGTRWYSALTLETSAFEWFEDDERVAAGLAYVAMRDPIAGIEPHVIELDSSIEPLSRGCGGIGREAELNASLGSPLQGGLSVEGRSSAGNLALVFLSAPPLRPTPLPSAGRCILDVDPNAFVVLLQTALTNSRFAQSWPLPAEPALRGVQATLQAAIAPTDAPLGFDLSNGLLVNLWR